MEKSKGFICFAIDGRIKNEFYLRDGEVFRAPMEAPIMSDGFRCGRWECSLANWERFKAFLLKPYASVVEA